MNDTQIVRALPTPQDVQTIRANFDAAFDYYTPQIAEALPDHIPLARFKRVVITAINQNPDLYSADRLSLFNSCIKCAQDGLYPDNREAALVVFNTEVKRKGADGIERSVYVPIVQYMPMIAGIRKRMRNSGEVLSAIAEVVHRNDKFRHVKGEDERIEHEPCGLLEEPGDTVGAYAIIKLTNGEVLRDVMSFKDIERSRAQSRAKNSLMWTKFWDEGAKKTVLRRCAKAAPSDSDMQRLLARDEEPLALPDASDIPIPPPRPRREQFEAPTEKTSEAPAEEVRLYDVTNCDGEVHICTIDTVAENMLAVFAEAQRRGMQAIEAAIENNEDTLIELSNAGEHAIAGPLFIELAQLRGLVAQSKQNAEQQNPADSPPAPSPAALPPDAPRAQGVAPTPLPERVSYAVRPVYDKNGEIAYRTWWLGAFMNRLRTAKTAEEFTGYVADNGEMIQGYYATLTPPALIAAKKELDDIKKGIA